MTFRLAPRSLPTRIRERLVARVIEARLARDGMHPGMIPPMLRRHVSAVGFDDTELLAMLASVRSLDAWSLRWREIARAARDDGDLDRSWRAGFLAQRTFDRRSDEREAIYREACDAYRACHPEVRSVSVAYSQGGRVGGLLDLPTHMPIDGAAPPLIVLFTGLGVVAQELHDLAAIAWKQGYATLRVDAPGWGSTTVRMRPETSMFARDLLDSILVPEVAAEYGFDPDRVVCAGTCIGGIFAMLAASGGRVERVLAVSAPWTLERIMHRWPGPVRALVESATHLQWREASRQLATWSRANRSVAASLRIPIEVHAAGRDRLTPLEDQLQLARDLGSHATLHTHEREVHACPGILDDILADWLDRRDPEARALLSRPGSARIDAEALECAQSNSDNEYEQDFHAGAIGGPDEVLEKSRELGPGQTGIVLVP